MGYSRALVSRGFLPVGVTSASQFVHAHFAVPAMRRQ
jgi:hypothetical protein